MPAEEPSFDGNEAEEKSYDEIKEAKEEMDKAAKEAVENAKENPEEKARDNEAFNDAVEAYKEALEKAAKSAEFDTKDLKENLKKFAKIDPPFTDEGKLDPDKMQDVKQDALDKANEADPGDDPFDPSDDPGDNPSEGGGDKGGKSEKSWAEDRAQEVKDAASLKNLFRVLLALGLARLLYGILHHNGGCLTNDATVAKGNLSGGWKSLVTNKPNVFSIDKSASENCGGYSCSFCYYPDLPGTGNQAIGIKYVGCFIQG